MTLKIYSQNKKNYKIYFNFANELFLKILILPKNIWKKILRIILEIQKFI